MPQSLTAVHQRQFAGDIPANLMHCADSPELPGVIEIAIGIPDAVSDRVVFRDAIGALKVRYGFLRIAFHIGCRQEAGRSVGLCYVSHCLGVALRGWWCLGR